MFQFKLAIYIATAIRLLSLFDVAYLRHILREENQEANNLSQMTSGYKSVDVESVVGIEFRKKVNSHYI